MRDLTNLYKHLMEGNKEEPGLSVVVSERTSSNEPKLRLKKIHLNMRKIVS